MADAEKNRKRQQQRQARQDIIYDRGSFNLRVPHADCGEWFSNHRVYHDSKSSTHVANGCTLDSHYASNSFIEFHFHVTEHIGGRGACGREEEERQRVRVEKGRD